MNAYDYPTIVLKLESEIERKIEEFERICYDLKASEEATNQARIRRLQLIAVRNLINLKTHTL
jgi:hypothetical protein